MEDVGASEKSHISDIVKALNSGVDFYTQARDKVNDPALATLFEFTANKRRQIIERFQPYIEAEKGAPEEGNSFVLETRKLYTNILALVVPDSEYAYIQQLYEVEENTLKAIIAALDEEPAVDCRAVLVNAYDEVGECQDKLRAQIKTRK
ncbi:PA2169 family four-helix-bundle protein [Exilibacterium tricleocarpae]|uniref:PA2169 family four-helix-bundle protein n=1 Tax=Exilibacterium tricleocarpae TaxID=2591008 RepID=A0A545TNK4_9GAMM|nr:PA2169 family four-helix-bundle protein [Exilibacterium tricleocarpae]TQV78807.1 PA2169 family four-helix-bundle protein [Exilibacterium tricleocarpae]